MTGDRVDVRIRWRADVAAVPVVGREVGVTSEAANVVLAPLIAVTGVVGHASTIRLVDTGDVTTFRRRVRLAVIALGSLLDFTGRGTQRALADELDWRPLAPRDGFIRDREAIHGDLVKAINAADLPPEEAAEMLAYFEATLEQVYRPLLRIDHHGC
jgi:hypothetical protein